MEGKVAAIFFILLYTVCCSPTDLNDFDMDNEEMQNDNDNYGADYDVTADEVIDTVEESKMPDVPIEITTQKQQFIKDLGETVVLPCTILGKNYVLVWRKNGAVLFQSDIKVAAKSNMKLLSNGSLEISNLHGQDAGEYECSALGSKQDSPSIQHEVILRAPPQIELLEAKDNITVLRSGDTLILTCKAKGYPKPVISWHKGSSRFDIQGEVLEKSKINHHDAGTYKCLADNKIGEPAFSYINIKVEFKPVVIFEKLSVSSENSSETELECIVHSEPRAQVTWIKDGLNVASSDRIQLVTNEHKHNLILKDIKDSDYGVYSCLATNSLGRVLKDIKLVATPAVNHFSKSQEDGKVVLRWQVQSKSNLSGNEFLYRKQEESEAKTFLLEGPAEVNHVSKDIYEVKYTFNRGLDAGEYHLKFRCRNNKGWSEWKDEKIEVLAKHGHHKPHKKGHKHGKEKQVTPTPTLPSQPDAAEHQEHEYQSGFIKESPPSATGTTGSSSITTPRILLIGLALLTFYHVRI